MSTHSLIEISLSGLDDEATQSIINLFDKWGRGGSVIEQTLGEHAGPKVKTYLLPEDDDRLRQIEIGLELLNQARNASSSEGLVLTERLPEPHIRFLAEADWAEAWKTGYDVLRVGRRLVIKPTWRDYTSRPGDLVIALDPGMAFGSGLHPTTQLCLEALEDYLHTHATVLDVGTGSGILAIAAARLGASRVLALDTDPLATRIARENATLNQVEPVVHVEVGIVQISPSTNQQASALHGFPTSNLQSQAWDLVVANILAETIIELAPELAKNVSSEGTLIVSGIIADRTEAVIASLRENGLSLVEQRDEGEWVALIARKDRAQVSNL